MRVASLPVLALLLGLLLGAGAHAQVPPIAGVDYRVLKAARASATAAKIEVVEFFWYRCPHCYLLEPAVEHWLSRLPADAQFKRVPVVFGDEWAIDARIFYALSAIGEIDRVHRPLLDAIHEQGGKQLRGEAYAKWIAAWLAAHGVDAGRYAAAFHSRPVEEEVARAAQWTLAYGVGGTPNFAVDGRYLVGPAPGDRRRILQIADYLIHEASNARMARR